MSNAGRARYDVLRIMRGVAADDGGSSPRKSPRTRHLDVLTSEDILQEKYQELGQLLAAQFVERKALSVLESTLLSQKKKRKGKTSAKKERNNVKGRKVRPSSAKSFVSEDSTRYYDSDYTDYTEASAASSGKRVSFADDVISFSGESSVVITEITEDDADFEERIKRKPRVNKEEEEIEALEMNSNHKHDIEKELIQSILRSPRSKSRRTYVSPAASRSTTPTTPRRQSPKRLPKAEKQRSNYDKMADSNERTDKYDETSANTSSHTIYSDHSDNEDKQEVKKSRKKSPRKGKRRSTTPNSNNNSPRKGRTSTSPTRKGKSKSPRKTKPEEVEEIPPELQQRPVKEWDPIDNQLVNSKNKHIKSWLRQKDTAIRRQKREEQKKEKAKHEAEEKEREERAQRLEEAKERYNEWMRNKKRVTRQNRRVVRKVVNENEEQTPSNDVSEGEVKPRKATKKLIRRPISIRMPVKKEPPKTTHNNNIGIVKDYNGDWTDSVNFKRDLAGERERDEEKRQAKEAKKREKIQKAKLAAERKNQPKAPKTKRSFPRGQSSPRKTPDSKEKIETAEQKPLPKTKPSSNPFKGMTYDQWLNQKIKTEQVKREESKKELADPDLEDLIPLLAKHRIEHAKEPSRRVDSGLSRPKSSADPRKPENKKAFDNDNARPYTWKGNSDTKQTKGNQWKSFPKGNSNLHVNSPTPPRTPLRSSGTGSRKSMNSDTDDVFRSVRPEPQGCEIPSPASHCQSANINVKGSDQDAVFLTEALLREIVH